MLMNKEVLGSFEISSQIHKILLMDIFLKEKIMNLHPFFIVVCRTWGIG